MSSVWENVDTGKGTNFLKLDTEETIIRVGSGPSEVEVHFEETFTGTRKRAICPGAGCPLCRNGSVPYKRFTLKVIHREDGQAYLFECGSMIAKDIKRYALNSKHGDPTRYDIKIQKIGERKQTKYKVYASPNKSDITASEAALLSELDLAAAIKPASLEEIKAMGFKIVPIEIVNEPKRPEVEDVHDSDWDDL